MKRLLTIILFLAACNAFGQVKPKQIAPGSEGENLFIRSGTPTWDTITVSDVSGINTFIHNSTIQSASVTGTATKTIKLTRGDNTFITTTFTDKDNQTLTYVSGSKTLSISGGNSVVLPIDYGELQQTITGQTSPVFTLSQAINTSKHLIIVMNTAVIYPEDYSITGANQITLSFVPSSSDRFLFYYKN